VKQLDGRGAAPSRRPERRHGLARGGSASEPRKRPSVSLLKNRKLSDDWHAHAWILSHCWPEQLSESRILQPAQPTWM